MQPNPLAKHFRTPELYLKLPSLGEYWPNKSLDLPETQEIPIFGMTVKDEMLLKNPDGLMSGQAVVDVIQSCCPNIKNAWEMPGIDVDPVFIAIRIASYGKGMDVTTSCPHCNNRNEHTVDLTAVLQQIQPKQYNHDFSLNGLTFTFKPQTYKEITKSKTISFEQQKLIEQVVANESMTQEEKTRYFNAGFTKLKELNLSALTDSIVQIALDDGQIVTDRKHINEFIENSSRTVFEQIKDHVKQLNQQFALPAVTLQCDNEECQKHYSSQLEFDQSSFFD